MEYITYLIGFITGIVIAWLNSNKHDPYMKGYDDGFKDAFEFIKNELEKRRAK
jgi:hypothetical protein